MSDSTYVAGFYTSVPADSIPRRVVYGLERAGLDVRATESNESITASVADEYRFRAPLQRGSFIVKYTINNNRDFEKPAVQLTSFSHFVDPYWSEDADEYHRRMSAGFELLSWLAIALETDYVALVEAQTHGQDATPSGHPIAETISVPPPFGIYSPTVLDRFGGTAGVTDTQPWCAVELTDGRTVIITTEKPWGDGGWQPPTSAEFIDHIEHHPDDDADGQSEHHQADAPDKFDSFAALEPGEYGTDVGVHPDDIAPEFHNEDLRLARVYRDDQGNLRRVEGGGFVRNVVVDPENDEALVRGMLAEIPPSADNNNLLVSALLHGAIPSSFVRLDDPGGENVVSRVLDLDIETNKVDLLVSLGDAAQHEDGLDHHTIESALDNLADLENVDGIDRYIEQNLL